MLRSPVAQPDNVQIHLRHCRPTENVKIRDLMQVPVEPWDLLSCVVADMYLEARDYELGLVLLDLLGKPKSWSEWAEAVGPDAVQELETRLALRSLDEFLDLVDSLSRDPPQGCSRNSLLLLHLRSVSLRCRVLPFHVLVVTYERLVSWLRGESLPALPKPPLEAAKARLDHEEVRRELARLTERSALTSPAESALQLAEANREMGAPNPGLAREAAALAAELGDDALVKRAAAVLKKEDKKALPPITDTNALAFINALETGDEATLVALLNEKSV